MPAQMVVVETNCHVLQCVTTPHLHLQSAPPSFFGVEAYLFADAYRSYIPFLSTVVRAATSITVVETLTQPRLNTETGIGLRLACTLLLQGLTSYASGVHSLLFVMVACLLARTGGLIAGAQSPYASEDVDVAAVVEKERVAKLRRSWAGFLHQVMCVLAVFELGLWRDLQTNGSDIAAVYFYVNCVLFFVASTLVSEEVLNYLS